MLRLSKKPEVRVHSTPRHIRVKRRVFLAYPFRLDPWDAQGLMDAASLAMHFGIRMKLFHHWQSAGAGSLVNLFTQIQKRRSPLRVKALYFPAWNISASYSFVTLNKQAKFVRMALHSRRITSP